MHQQMTSAIVELCRMLIAAVRRCRLWFDKMRWLPASLASSRLVYAEKTFSISQPIRLTVRVDRAYHDGTALILAEFKTRFTDGIYHSDIIELSAQRVAVQHMTGVPVHDFAFVLLHHPLTQRRGSRKVYLLNEHEVLGIANRRKQLITGAIEPRPASRAKSCYRCEYRTECETGMHSITTHRFGDAVQD